MLLDPAFSRFSFAKMCERAGLKTGEMLQLFTRHQLDVALVETAQKLPAIIRAVVRDALEGDHQAQELLLEALQLIGSEGVGTNPPGTAEPSSDVTELILKTRRILKQEHPVSETR